jgi:serine/threonine protein phosphatase PrpC
MGTTLTMSYSVGHDLYIVHAGDSRAYLFREGNLEQITSDHTLVQLLVSGGVLSPEDAKTHARRNVVTNVIGGPSAGVHAEIHKVRLNDGDVLLLCSDGLTEPVSDEMIAETLDRTSDPEIAAAQLVALALEKGGPDNVTAVVARYSIEDPSNQL